MSAGGIASIPGPVATPETAGERWGYALRRAGTHSLLIWPPLAVAWVFFIGLTRHAMSLDFQHAYLPAAHAVLDGRTPYPPVTVAALFPRTAFVYPPLTAFLAAPFTLLPSAAAGLVVAFLVIAAVTGVLYLLEIRDWRCYMIVFLWLPTYASIQIGNVTVLVVLGLALLWRYRHRVVAVAVIVGFLIALKLFVWPLLVWLVATRRIRAAVGAAAAGAGLIVAPWAGIGFLGMRGYPHLLSVLTRAERPDQYTISALLARGFSWRVAEIAAFAVGIVVLAAGSRLARRDDRASFVLTVAAILLLSPLVEMHYFLFLLVIVALYVPRFGPVWVIPLLLWVGPQVGQAADWRTAAVLATATATVVLAWRRGERPVSIGPARVVASGGPAALPRSPVAAE